jgi:hypothetical protein
MGTWSALTLRWLLYVSSYEQLQECWNKLFALKQEFGNCP